MNALSKQGRLRTHQTSKNELDSIRALIQRDLDDAAIEELSSDRRFATAYNAVLQLGKMALACAGYRTSSTTGGHHKTTFDALELILGSAHSQLITYFDTCRRKRNQVDYDMAGVASDADADELVTKVSELQTVIEDWIAKNHSQYI